MKKLFLLLAVIGLTVGLASPASATTDIKLTGKVTICHATGSATNPYVRVHVSVNAINGHGTEGNLTVAGLLTYLGLPVGADVKAYFNLDEGHELDLILKGDAQCPAGLPIPDVKCSDFTTRAALEAFLAGLNVDVRAAVMLELDKDEDGIACEDLTNPEPPKDGEDGEDGKDGVDGKDGLPGKDGTTTVVTETVEKIVTVPSFACVDASGNPFVSSQPCPPVEAPPAPPAPAPTGELPHTGGESLPLAGLGGSLTGLGLFLRKLFKK